MISLRSQIGLSIPIASIIKVGIKGPAQRSTFGQDMVQSDDLSGGGDPLPPRTAAVFETRYASKAQLLAALRQALTSGDLRVGSRLPTERNVAARTGLSRAAVRSALDQLAAEGLLLRRVGRGTFAAEGVGNGSVGAGSGRAASAPHASPAEILALRTVIEPRLPDLIVLNAAETQLEEMRAFVLRGRGSRDWRDCEAWDAGFHRLLFHATGNQLFRELGDRIAAERRSEAWQRLKQRDFSPENWQIYQGEHEEIVEALCNRDRAHSRDLLFRHLTGVQQRLLG